MNSFLLSIVTFLNGVIGVNSHQAGDHFHRVLIHTENEVVEVFAEKAITAQEQEQGLMGQSQLRPGYGMIFINKEPVIPRFWMKNMLISIDMIFIGEDLKINHIVESAPPCKVDPCKIYSDDEKAQYILEVPAGFSSKNVIKSGQKIELK